MLNKVSWPVMSLLLTACVTINIYFPAAAAEEAARTIVRDVLGNEAQQQEQQEEQESQPGKDDKQSSLEQEPTALLLVGRMLEVMIPAANAAQVNINIDTAAISKLRSSMNKRQGKLAPFYKAGAIGFDQKGTVTVRDQKAVSLKERNTMKKLVADENRDRNALYREIARANGHTEWEQDIRKTFARIWVEEAPGGYWYKDSAGGWVKK